MLALYHNDMSLCAQKVRVCLAEKGLEWENRHLVLRAASTNSLGISSSTAEPWCRPSSTATRSYRNRTSSSNISTRPIPIRALAPRDAMAAPGCGCGPSSSTRMSTMRRRRS